MKFLDNEKLCLSAVFVVYCAEGCKIIVYLLHTRNGSCNYRNASICCNNKLMYMICGYKAFRGYKKKADIIKRYAAFEK